jgi:hypothetical protein
MRKQDLDSNDPKFFDVIVGELIAHVSVHIIKSAKVFHLVYDGGREPLNMTIANADDGSKFWTSLPEGRQEEAELAGAAVAAYLREYRRNQLCVTTTDKRSAAPSLFD